MNIYQIVDKATGENLVRLTATGVRRARWQFYATKGFGQHGEIICRLVGKALERDVSMPIATHRGERLKIRGQCEKCNTPTNWIVTTAGRSGAYWCGCE